MRDPYIDQCKQIQQNCTYTAQTHHVLADKYSKLSVAFQIVPAVIAAATATWSTAGNSPGWASWLTVVSTVTAAVATVLGPDKQYQQHLAAAKSFTTIKHDARALHEAFGLRMTLVLRIFCILAQLPQPARNPRVSYGIMMVFGGGCFSIEPVGSLKFIG